MGSSEMGPPGSAICSLPWWTRHLRSLQCGVEFAGASQWQGQSWSRLTGWGSPAFVKTRFGLRMPAGLMGLDSLEIVQ